MDITKPAVKIEDLKCPNCGPDGKLRWYWDSSIEGMDEAHVLCQTCGSIGTREAFEQPITIEQALAVLEQTFSTIH